MKIREMADWKDKSWDIKNTYLHSLFRTGEITQASRKDLEEYLVVLAHADDKADPYPKQTPHFRAVVGQLLHIRISEELHWRSMVAACVSIVISALALLVAWDEHQLRIAAAHNSTSVSSAPLPPKQVPKP
jgi:hypothetical protein